MMVQKVKSIFAVFIDVDCLMPGQVRVLVSTTNFFFDVSQRDVALVQHLLWADIAKQAIQVP